MRSEMERDIEALDRYASQCATAAMSGPESRARLNKLMSGLPDRRQAGNADARRPMLRLAIGFLILFAAFVFGLWLNATGRVG